MPRRLIVSLILILSPFLLLEGGARLVVWAYGRWVNPFEERQFARDSVVTRRNVYLRYDFVKGRTGFVSYDRAHINSLGFRGPEFSPVKQPGELRVVCLGNSVTFGWGVSADSLTYPARLERWLWARYPNRLIRVINAGMPRFNSHDILGVLLQKVVPLHPDIVVILSGWNDLEDGIVGVPDQPVSARLALSRTYAVIDRGLWVAARYSEFVSLLRRGIGYLLVQLPGTPVAEGEYDTVIAALERWPKTDRLDPAGLATFRRALEATVDVCRRHQIRPVLLTWPNFFHEGLSQAEKRVLLGHLLKFPNLSYRGWLRAITACNETIRSVARTEGVMCIDVANVEDYRLFRDAAHLTEVGYDRLGRRVAEGLPIE